MGPFSEHHECSISTRLKASAGSAVSYFGLRPQGWCSLSWGLQGLAVKFRHSTTLRTDFDTEECRRHLIESIDPERRTVFSLSGYKGSKPVIGRIEGNRFYLHKRRYWHNDFAPQFYGNLLPQARGTLIEGYFDVRRWTKIFMRIWLGGVLLLGSPIFARSLLDVLKGRSYMEGDLQVGLLVPPCMVLFGILFPKLGLWFGRGEERFILEFLQSRLVAGITNPN